MEARNETAERKKRRTFAECIIERLDNLEHMMTSGYFTPPGLSPSDPNSEKVNQLDEELHLLKEKVERLEALLFHADYKSFEALDKFLDIQRSTDCDKQGMVGMPPKEQATLGMESPISPSTCIGASFEEVCFSPDLSRDLSIVYESGRDAAPVLFNMFDLASDMGTQTHSGDFPEHGGTEIAVQTAPPRPHRKARCNGRAVQATHDTMETPTQSESQDTQLRDDAQVYAEALPDEGQVIATLSLENQAQLSEMFENRLDHYFKIDRCT